MRTRLLLAVLMGALALLASSCATSPNSGPTGAGVRQPASVSTTPTTVGVVSAGEHDGIRITYELTTISGEGWESTLTVVNGSPRDLKAYDITVYLGAADGRKVPLEATRSARTTAPWPRGKIDVGTSRSDSSIFPYDWPRVGEVWVSYTGTGGSFETEHVPYPPSHP